MLFFSDVFSAAARRETMRGQETRELVGLGDWSITDPIDFTPDAGTGVLRPEFQQADPGTGAAVPGTGVLQPQNLTDPALVAAAAGRRVSTSATPFYKQPWFMPAAAGGALLLGLVLLGGKK